MKYHLLSRKLFSCLIILFCTTAFAQHRIDEVTPGIDGPLPEVQQAPPAENGIIGCLHLDRVYSDAWIRYNGSLSIDIYADFSFPTPSTFGADSLTLQKYDTQSASWVDFEYNNESVTTTGDNFSINIEYLGNISFRLKLNGGEKNGYVSNSVLVEQPALHSEMTYWSSGFPYNALVGEIFEKPSFSIGTYNSEIDDFENVPSPDSYCTYKWYRRNPNSYEMTLIEGADSSTYKATIDDAGYQIVLLVEGDDIHYSLFYQLESPIVTYPINCSFEYKGYDGFVINTNYILPEDITSAISLSYYGEYDTNTQSSPILNFPIDQINTLKDGQYAILCNNLEENSYEFVLSNKMYSMIQTSTIMEDFKMVNNLNAYIDSQPMFISAELDGSPITCDFELLSKNINGEIKAVTITDSLKRDTTMVMLLTGDYYIKVPSADNYETTYFPNKAVWNDADTVNHPSRTYDYNDSVFVVNLIKTLPSTIGSGVIEGVVTNVENVTNSPARKVIPIDYTTYTLYLTDSNGDLIAKTTSDANGAYRFSNLPLGEYYIIIDVEGVKMSNLPHHVTLTAEQSSVSGADYQISNEGVEATGILLGIETINTDSTDINDVIYDLKGKVMNSIPDHGFFIVNGNIYFAE